MRGRGRRCIAIWRARRPCQPRCCEPTVRVHRGPDAQRRRDAAGTAGRLRAAARRWSVRRRCRRFGIDGTLELLRGRVDRLVTIPAGAFDHGATRNLAVEQTQGDLVVLIVQDAVPESETWLKALTAPLRADAGLAGAFARQIPRSDAS